jgi:hypothetical protein
MQSGPQYRSTWRLIDQGIDKDEFGRSLFNAIFLCGEILQLQANQEMESAKKVPYLVEDYKKREYLKAKELAGAMDTLKPLEQKALMSRYPRLFGRKAA